MKAIKFSLLTNEEKHRISVTEVINENDLTSPLMGTTSDKKTCVTCGKRAACSGHCGLIRLPHSMPNPLFEKMIVQHINSHCHNCGKSLIHKKLKTECQSCKHINITNYKFEEGRMKLSPDEIARVLKISGLESLMIDSVLVPPSRIRVTAPEYPQSTELSKMYVKLLRNKDKYEYVKAIMGSQRNSGLYKLISGKEGLFRQNIFGKRVNRSARTIVVGDPFLPIECVRLPQEMMDVLCPEVRVTFHNVSAVRTMEVRAKDGQVVQPHQILPGNTFYRACQEGDMVCINRQPSLSKYSLMSFGIKKGNSKVMMINPCVTTAFNADFDGDEMNVFLLDDVQSRCEVREILNVKNNSEVLQPVQDTITGSYLMSKGTHVESYEFDNYYMYADTPFEHFARCKRTCSTRGIVSLALPFDFNLNSENVVIKDGVLETGILTKKTLLNIMPLLSDRCKFLNVLQKITSIWLMSNGLSISLTEYKTDVNFDSLEREISVSSDENEVKQAIDNFRAEHAWPETDLSHIVTSGAKGQALNIMQMCCYVGQQYIGGNRVREGDLESSGFIKSSYMQGLNPAEYFFHQMAAREGVVNTGVSTSETGYLGRRATKIISDVVTNYNGLVTEHSRIISF